MLQTMETEQSQSNTEQANTEQTPTKDEEMKEEGKDGDKKVGLHDMRLMRKPVLRFSSWFDLNWPSHLQRPAKLVPTFQIRNKIS